MIVVEKPVTREIDIDEPPPTILYGWLMLPSNRIVAERFENHPKLGSGRNIMTSKIVYIDEIIGIAKSQNTTYILKDEIK